MGDTIHVTIWNAEGRVVVDEECEGQCATPAQIDDMVAMIESGTPAWIAAYLALKQPPSL